MAEQLPQVSKLIAVLVEHMRFFEGLPSGARQWVIQNPRAAIELFKKAVMERKESLFALINKITVSGQKSFVVANKYQVGRTSGVNILNVSEAFKKHASPYIEENVDAATLSVYSLMRSDSNVSIKSAAGDLLKDHPNTFSHFLEYLKTASHMRPSFCFIYMKGRYWILTASWLPIFNGWEIDLLEFPGDQMWEADDLFVSRKVLDN